MQITQAVQLGQNRAIQRPQLLLVDRMEPGDLARLLVRRLELQLNRLNQLERNEFFDERAAFFCSPSTSSASDASLCRRYAVSAPLDSNSASPTDS